jgi:hypothetical protein
MARKKSSTAVTRKKAGKKKGKKRGAVAQIVRIHNLNGNSPVDGDAVSGNTTNPALTVVGFVKPANSQVDCQLYTSGGTVLSAPRSVTATQYRWTVSFGTSEVSQGTQYLFEANLSGQTVSAFVAFTLS